MNKIFSIINLILGIAIISLSYLFSTTMKCFNCSLWESWKGSIPMLIFAFLLITSSPLLWKNKKIGKYLSIITWIAGIVFIILSVFATRVITK